MLGHELALRRVQRLKHRQIVGRRGGCARTEVALCKRSDGHVARRAPRAHALQRRACQEQRQQCRRGGAHGDGAGAEREWGWQAVRPIIPSTACGM